MKQGMIVALFVSGLAFAFGTAPAPTDATPSQVSASSVLVAPAVALDADELQGGSCGDRSCDPPEDCHSCPQDCGDCCGNNRCEPPEDCNSCPQDCRC